MYKFVIVCCALASVAVADHPDPYAAPLPPPPPPPPSPGYKTAPAYKPNPGYHPGNGAYDPKEISPVPFAYQYKVADDYTGASFDKAEEQDAYGNLQGSYRVNLPDGRVQIVTYQADRERGYVADVKYEGTPVYPPEPKEGYGHAYKAKHHPHAAPKYNPEYAAAAPHPGPEYAHPGPKYVTSDPHSA